MDQETIDQTGERIQELDMVAMLEEFRDIPEKIKVADLEGIDRLKTIHMFSNVPPADPMRVAAEWKVKENVVERYYLKLKWDTLSQILTIMSGGNPESPYEPGFYEDNRDNGGGSAGPMIWTGREAPNAEGQKNPNGDSDQRSPE